MEQSSERRTLEGYHFTEGVCLLWWEGWWDELQPDDDLPSVYFRSKETLDYQARDQGEMHCKKSLR